MVNLALEGTGRQCNTVGESMALTSCVSGLADDLTCHWSFSHLWNIGCNSIDFTGLMRTYLWWTQHPLPKHPFHPSCLRLQRVSRTPSPPQWFVRDGQVRANLGLSYSRTNWSSNGRTERHKESWVFITEPLNEPVLKAVNLWSPSYVT